MLNRFNSAHKYKHSYRDKLYNTIIKNVQQLKAKMNKLQLTYRIQMIQIKLIVQINYSNNILN